MKRKKISWVLGAMALALLLCVPSISRSLAVDLGENNCALSFKVLDDYDTDLKNSDMVVDVYKVAVAVADPNYDTYSFESVQGFEDLAPSLQNINAVDYEALAQQAAQIVVDGKMSPVDSVPVADKIENMEPGLYLTMPHNERYSLAESIEKVMVGDGTSTMHTFVNTPLYKYEFNPLLVALPSRTGTLGNNTANTDPWEYDFTMLLKTSQKQRKDGSLIINKTIDRFGGSGIPTFVFKIVAEQEGKIVFSTVEQIQIESGTSGSVRVDGIPAGSTVTVTEEYTGASYVADSDQELTLTLDDADIPLEFNFRNRFNDNNTHGTSVNNQYTYNEEGERVVNNGQEENE